VEEAKHAEEEAKRVEEEAKRAEEEAKREKLADEQWNKMKADEDAKRAVEEAKRVEEEAKRAEEEAKRAEEEAKREKLADEQRNKMKADEDVKRAAEEAKRAEEEAQIKQDEEVVARAVELVQENPNRFKLVSGEVLVHFRMYADFQLAIPCRSYRPVRVLQKEEYHMQGTCGPDM
jgi:hypothetical protein